MLVLRTMERKGVGECEEWERSDRWTGAFAVVFLSVRKDAGCGGWRGLDMKWMSGARDGV